MSVDINNKTGDLLRYLIKRHPNPTVTVLMKLCYLVDLVALKNSDNKVSDFRYIRYKFGPFDKSIYTYLESLAENHSVSQEQGFANETANDFIVYIPGQSAKDEYPLLSAVDVSAADKVLDEVSGYGAKALTDIAYKTKPMLAIGATRGGDEGLYAELNLKA